jgi:hypothetical protein
MALNMQNLPRVLPGSRKLSDVLRYSLRAPPGYKVVVVDLSGIELRINMYLWKVRYAMELFRRDPVKADLYRRMAAKVFHILEAEIVKMQRQAGKAMHLGCGFGLNSVEKFIAVAKTMAQIDVTPAEARQYIDAWRREHPEIVGGWTTCHTALEYAYAGKNFQIDPWGLCFTDKDCIVTPNGMIRYPGLHRERSPKTGRDEWWYGSGRNRARIYAGKVDENIVQHLARRRMVDAILDFDQTDLGRLYPLAHTVHDELPYVVRDEHAEEVCNTLVALMSASVPWWPELITSAEGSFAQTYGGAK